MVDIAALTDECEKLAQKLGFDLVRVQFTRPKDDKTLQVMAERPETGQLIIDDCAALSRLISDRLDELDPIEENYSLEVSSPGIDRPLTREKDFVNWAGHDAKLNLREKINGKKHVGGELLGLNDGIVQVKKQNGEIVDIAYDAIHSAKLILTDRLIAATRPVDMSGVDDIEDDDIAEDDMIEGDIADMANDESDDEA